MFSDTPMKSPNIFDIEFDAPGKVYFSEQLVSGQVRLEVEEPINLKGIFVVFLFYK